MRTYNSFGAAAAAFRRMREKVFPPSRATKPFPPAIRAIYAGMYEISASSRGHFAQRGIGRAIWGNKTGGWGGSWGEAAGTTKKSNLPNLVHPTDVQGSGERFTAGIIVSGIPAMIERGGKTKPHAIYPWKSTGSKFGSKWMASRKLGLAELGQWSVRRGRKTLVGWGNLKLADGSYRRFVKRHTATIPKRSVVEPALSGAEPLLARMVKRAVEAGAEKEIEGA